MKRFVVAFSFFISTLPIFATPPTAEFVPYHAIIEGQEYAIINMIKIGEKSFVQICSQEGNDYKLIGKENIVYEMPDTSDMEGIDFDTIHSKEVKDIVGYKQNYDFVMNKPGTLIGSFFIHAFTAYGVYHAVLKLKEKAAVEKRYARLIASLRRLKQACTTS